MRRPAEVHPLEVVDSHTAGEPTRTVVGGMPDLGSGSIDRRLARLRQDHDWVRTSLIAEPRGSDVMVGAALIPPTRPDCVAGVIFFNNVGYLGMCGHGLIGVVTTLAGQGQIEPGRHRIETPVGVVAIELREDGRVSFDNVPSYRLHRKISITLADGGRITGDVAWGGNWFFLCAIESVQIARHNVLTLTRVATDIREALREAGIRGTGGADIDHVELVEWAAGESGPEVLNFVLCPGLAYDRSPCGTGTSAKIACLAADGRLEEGHWIRVRGICGETFHATYRVADGKADGIPQVVPTIVGRAHITARTQVLFDPQDPFRFGIGT